MEHGIALYLAFISKPGMQRAWYEHTGYLPMGNAFQAPAHSILDIAKLDLNDPHQSVFRASVIVPQAAPNTTRDVDREGGETMTEAVSRVESGAENQVRMIHDQMLEAIFSGMMSVDDALTKAQRRIQHVVQRFRKNTS